MTAILGALSSGHTAKQILRYLSQQNPKLAQQISTAINAGHSLDHIVSYMSKQEKKLGKLIPDQSESRSDNLYKTAQNDLHPSLLGGAKALGVGLGAAAAVGGGMAAMAGRNAAVQASQILPALQQQAQLPTPNQTLQIGQIAPVNPPTPPPTSPTPPPIQPGHNIGQQVGGQAAQPVMNAMQPTQDNQIAAASQAIPDQMQPQTPKQMPIFEQLLGGVDPSTLDQPKQEQLKFLALISDQLQSKGKTINDPEFKNLAKKIKDVLGGKPSMMVEENARFQAGQQPKNANVNPLYNEQPISPIEQVKEKPMAKGASVITPNGDLAIVEDHPGKAAKVSIDGKNQVFDADDLVPVPDNHEEIGEIYQKLIDKIPEGHKSRVYDAIGYDPNRNAIKYTYHDGKTYIIDDVPEDIVKEITNSGYLAKTSGGNYMGFYYKGNPSIGAGMHVLISDLQKLRGGKGKEYSYKFEELYSQHRLPKNILKEKHEREKAREREEKKAKKKRSLT